MKMLAHTQGISFVYGGNGMTLNSALCVEAFTLGSSIEA
jgi:hypothetical protein